MGSFLKDFPSIPSLQDSTLVSVGDGTINTYKTTMLDVAGYIGAHPVLTPPLVLKDDAAFTPSGTGTISWVGATGAATLSLLANYDALFVEDVIIVNGEVSNVVVAKLGFPNITVLKSYDLVATVFDYGKADIITKDFSDNITGSYSKGGLGVVGAVLAEEKSSFRDDVKVYGQMEVNDISSYSGTVVNQYNNSDGLIKTDYQPSFRATMTSDQTILPNAWQKLPMNRANGTDPGNLTHSRVPVGKAGFDTSNYVFPVPYGSGYSGESYTISACCEFELSWSAGAYGIVYMRVEGTANATTLNGDTIFFQRLNIHTPTNNGIFSIGASCEALLNPGTYVNHRFLSVQVRFNIPYGMSMNAESNTEGAVWFSGVCHG